MQKINLATDYISARLIFLFLLIAISNVTFLIIKIQLLFLHF